MSLTQAKRIIPILIVIAIGGFWLFFTLTTPRGAFVNWLPGVPPSYDADMSYVYNSILPFAGYSYAHVYHPGTAMHIVGTGVGALAFPLAQLQGVSLAAFHASNPFPLLTTLRVLLGVMACVVSVGLFRRSVPLDSWRGVLMAAAVSVAFFAIYVFGFISLVSWAHASMGYTFGGIILLWLLTLTQRGEPIQRWQVWTLGAMSGIINATAYYYAPFVVTVALAVFGVRWANGRGFWRGVLGAVEAGIAAIVGFLLINAPIWHKFDEFIGSFTTLATSTGTHGTGERGLVSLEGLIVGAREVYRLYPTPYWVLGGLIVLSLVIMALQRGRLRQNGALWALQTAMIVHLVFGFLLIFRHPGGSYLNIVVPAAPIMMAVLFRVLDRPLERRIATGIATAVMLGFVAQYANAVSLHMETTSNVRVRLNDVDTLVADYAVQTGQSEDDVLLVTTYGTHFGCYGMWFGSGYTAYRLHEHVGSTCDNMVEFKGGFDGAQVAADEWRLLTDEDFCWDMAVLDNYGGEGLLGTFAEPFQTDSGYTVVVNDRIYQARESYRIDFDKRPCGVGWHTPQRDGEVSYAWTSDSTATVEMRLQPDTDYTLTLQLHAAIAPDVQESLQVRVNGEMIPLSSTDTPNQYAGTIPAAVVASNLHATPLTLTTNRTEVPGVERGDLRSLGVAVDYIDITNTP
jgi:hypothetical protein